jgi:hypothetical protein
MKLLLRKEWRVPETAAQKSCEVFLRQFRLRPDHSELELDAWRTLLWVSALGDYQHLAGLFVRNIVVYNYINNVFLFLNLFLQKRFMKFGRNCATLT